MIALLSLWALAAPPAIDEETSPVGVSPDLPDLERAPSVPESPTTPEIAPDESLPWPPEVYRGAEALGLDPAFVASVQDGLDLVYLRRYEQALAHFRRVEVTFPNTAIADVADTLVWQARMLENFDYRYDNEYWKSSKKAKAALDVVLAEPGREGWEHLLMAAVVGVESIHTMRKQHYLSALRLAFSAMDHIGESREAAPDFVDLELADGLYNYWRTVVTLNSKLLPSFGDHRVEGLEQMARVEREGIFVRPMATLALAFSWLEEKNMEKAAEACARNRRRYPDNIVNNIVSGIVAIYRKKYDDALQVLDQVHQVDASNMRAHYWKGIALMRRGDLELAKNELLTYLRSEHLEKQQLSYANFRLGQVHARAEEHERAAEYFQAAIRIDGHKGAKRALARLKDRRKEGAIDW